MYTNREAGGGGSNLHGKGPLSEVNWSEAIVPARVKDDVASKMGL